MFEQTDKTQLEIEVGEIIMAAELDGRPISRDTAIAEANRILENRKRILLQNYGDYIDTDDY